MPSHSLLFIIETVFCAVFAWNCQLRLTWIVHENFDYKKLWKTLKTVFWLWTDFSTFFHSTLTDFHSESGFGSNFHVIFNLVISLVPYIILSDPVLLALTQNRYTWMHFISNTWYIELLKSCNNNYFCRIIRVGWT